MVTAASSQITSLGFPVIKLAEGVTPPITVSVTTLLISEQLTPLKVDSIILLKVVVVLTAVGV